MNIIAIIIFICLLNFPVFSQILNNTNFINSMDSVVQNTVQDFMKDSTHIGLSLGIYLNGNTYTYNYGTTIRNNKIQPTDNTIYEIGSISKTITGLLLAQAVIDKKVNIDDDIRSYLKEDYPNLQYNGHPIKLFQLLNHSSGLPFNMWQRPEDSYNIIDDSVSYILNEIEKDYSKKEFLSDLHKVKIDTIPGIKLSYSNSAAQLLSYILENIYHMNFEDLIIKYISNPLGMRNTKLTYSQIEHNNFAFGYDRNGKQMPSNYSGAAGGISSTISDMLKYIKYQLNEDDPKVKLSHKTTWGDIKYYAMGLNWQMDYKANGELRIFQSGGTAGFSCYLAIYPKFNSGIVIFTNELDENSQGAISNIAEKIFGIAIYRK